MVRLDLNLQTISSDSIVTICSSGSLLEIIVGERDVLPVVSEKISHSSPSLFWSKISKSILGRKYSGTDVFDCFLLSLRDGFGAAQDTRNSVQVALLLST